MVTGLDLVEQMIRIAYGEKLKLKQADVKLKGWAIEARVYAEDPTRNFLPSTGRLVRYRPPVEDKHVRVDTGVYEGGEISIFYDPMIAKLVAGGATRAEATERMRQALDAFYIRGLRHNIPFLSALITHPRFAQGKLSTNLIAEEFPEGFHGATLSDAAMRALAAVAGMVHRVSAERASRISGQLPGHGRKLDSDLVVRLGKTTYQAVVAPAEAGCDVVVDGKALSVRSRWAPGEPLFAGTVDGKGLVVQIDRESVGWRLGHGGVSVLAIVLSPFGAQMLALMPEKVPPDTSKFLLSPMPGLLSQVAVKAGQDVKAGEALAVVEAMKMENVLRAERDAKVKTIHAEKGATLAVDQKIVEFE